MSTGCMDITARTGTDGNKSASIYAIDIDKEQSQFNNFTGNQQGLYTKGKPACFDLYIYRDAYTPVSAANPANQNNTRSQKSNIPQNILGSINNNDWAMYAGVEFGNEDYTKQADSVSVNASCMTSGGMIEIYLDSLTGAKIAEVAVNATGSWNNYKNFLAPVTEEVTGTHDVYLKFKIPFSWELFRLKTLTFIDKDLSSSAIDVSSGETDDGFTLEWETNYPNPFQTSTKITYYVPRYSYISLKVFNMHGTEINVLYEGSCHPGSYTSTFHAEGLSDGVYLCRLETENYAETKNLILIKQN